jgi:hypothetical protein
LITQQQINDTVTKDGLKEFGSFILSHCEDGNLPDYEKMDLMIIPHLVQNIFVYDLRTQKGRDRLLMNFCGSKIDELWGHNSLGKYDIDRFVGNPILEDVGRHRLKCVESKRPGYSHRYIKLTSEDNTEKFKYSESLFFPCSSDGTTINWTIACAFYDLMPFEGDNVFHRF